MMNYLKLPLSVLVKELGSILIEVWHSGFMLMQNGDVLKSTRELLYPEKLGWSLLTTPTAK